MAIFLVVLCSNFEQIMAATRDNITVDADLTCWFVDAELSIFPDHTFAVIMKSETDAKIYHAESSGAVVTGYLRLCDGVGFNPIMHEPGKSVADRINQLAFTKASEQPPDMHIG